MKRLLFSLAMIALASCVKESPVASVQPEADQISIKAVAVDSKTLLDGYNVVWEKSDEISVVLEGDTKAAATFAVVESSVNGSSADFVGAFGADLDNVKSAYAVYPASAVDLTANTITHELPVNQAGGVSSGMILSSAPLSVEDLEDRQARAEFKNALSLLNVVVPAGVKSVELTSANDGLVGKTNFNYSNGLLIRASVNTGRTVSLVSETELAAKNYPVLVYPGHVGNLTLKMVGIDETVFTKTISDITLNAGAVRKVDLTKIFHIDAAETVYASPLGGMLNIPVVMTADYEFTVSENSEWISVPATKAFHGADITLEVQQNLTSSVRTAQVSVSWGNESRTFTVSQAPLYLDFVYDAKAELIQWEEAFGVYVSEEDANAGLNAVKTFENVFTIELSDDFSKGTYKITNMFKTDAYYGVGYQHVYNKGGEYYADYASGKLTVKMNSAMKSYFFTQDVVLAYDSNAKKFTSAAPFPFTANTLSSYNKSGFVGGYVASAKSAVASDPIAGKWSVSCLMAPAFGGDFVEKTGEMIISGSDGKYVIESVAGESFNLSATFANNVLSAEKNSSKLKLTYNSTAGTLTQDGNDFQTWELPTVKSLTATKK